MKKKSKGSTLVMVIIVFMVLTVLGTSLLTIALADTKQVVSQEKKTKAYYAAYSGAEAMASYLIQNPLEAGNMVAKTALQPGKSTIDGNSIEVTVKNTGINELLIESKGIASGAAPVTVRLSLKTAESTLFKNTIFTDMALDLSGNTTTTGDVGTNADNLSLGSNFTGNVTIGPGADTDTINDIKEQLKTGKSVVQLGSRIVIPPIDTSKFPSAANYTAGSDITLNDGEKRYLRTSNLDKGMNVTGNGQLHLLVDSTFTLKGNSTISTPGNKAKVYIYYLGDTISFKGTPSFRGMIYAPNADMVCNGGGNGSFVGSIICKSYNSPQSNASSIIFDNELKIQDLTLTGTGVYVRTKWSD